MSWSSSAVEDADLRGQGGQLQPPHGGYKQGYTHFLRFVSIFLFLLYMGTPTIISPEFRQFFMCFVCRARLKAVTMAAYECWTTDSPPYSLQIMCPTTREMIEV